VAARIALIHAVHAAMGAVEAAFRELWPEAQRYNLLDDSLAPDRARDPALTPAMFHRIATLTQYAVQGGADGVLFTCSAFGEAIEAAAASVAVPVLKPNEAMFVEALAQATRVGMLITFPASRNGVQQEFAGVATAQGIGASLEVVCVPEAMHALQAGDGDRHDVLLAQAACGLTHCEAILLGQFSMARAAVAVQRAAGLPVLTSPASAVRALRARIGR
jgi:Asp/Glu/hydantoin racemase